MYYIFPGLISLCPSEPGANACIAASLEICTEHFVTVHCLNEGWFVLHCVLPIFSQFLCPCEHVSSSLSWHLNETASHNINKNYHESTEAVLEFRQLWVVRMGKAEGSWASLLRKGLENWVLIIGNTVYFALSTRKHNWSALENTGFIALP